MESSFPNGVFVICENILDLWIRYKIYIKLFCQHDNAIKTDIVG